MLSNRNLCRGLIMGKEPIRGKRKYAVDGELILAEGEYGKNPRNGYWYARPPGCHTGNLVNHEVIENPDGTITVKPSILISDGEKELWHGYLKNGYWREC